MAKLISKVCDRCGEFIKEGLDDMVLDFLEKAYPPNQDICPKCDLSIQIAGSLAEQDAINGDKPGTALKQMVELYNEPHHIF